MKAPRKKQIRCASCKKRIRAHEPDLVLEDLSQGGGVKRRYFHDRCSGAAYALAIDRPAVYILTTRHAG